MRVLIAGCGYVGGALADRLVSKGHSVVAIRRSGGVARSGVTWIAADLVNGSLPQDIGSVDAVVYAVAADEHSDFSYEQAYVSGVQNVISWLNNKASMSVPVVFVSSTGVYGQDDGSWVDETSETEPKAFNGIRLLEGEQLVLGANRRGLVVRFGGIYGPGRIGMIERAWSGQRSQNLDSGYINLIHRDDCAGVIEHLLEISTSDNVFIGVDCQPVKRSEIYAWLRTELGLSALSLDNIDPPARNKRCSNGRLLKSGYNFLYPTFQDGLAPLLTSYLRNRRCAE